MQRLIPGGEDDLLSFWIVLSDYSNLRWEAHGPFTDSRVLTLNSAAVRTRYVSKREGAKLPTFSYAVVARGGTEPGGGLRVESATTSVLDVVDSSYVTTNAHFTPIENITRSSSSMGARRASAVDPVELTWSHVFDSADNGRNEAIAYQVVRVGPGSQATSLPELVIGSVLAPSDIYRDPTDNIPNRPGPKPGETYNYYLRGFSVNNGYSGWSVDSPVTVALPQVLNVRASSYESTEHVHVTWDRAQDVKGYSVLRSEDSDPSNAIYLSGLMPSDDTLEYFDSAVELNQPYHYWVIPVGEGETLSDDDDIDTVAKGCPLSDPAIGIVGSLADWTVLTLESESTGGTFTSLAVVNGKPAISYYDDANAALKYAFSSTVDGSSEWTTVTVDAEGEVGISTSLAEVDGKPAISYCDVTNRDLKYAYSTEIDGSSGWITVVVDSEGDVGYDTSLAVVDGRPAISYFDGTNHDLKYAYSNTADGSSGWTTLAVDTTDSVGLYTSLAMVNGKPAISYYDLTNHDLKYAYSNTADGSSGWTTLAVDTSGVVGRFTSLEVIYGKPSISYFDFTNRDLKYAFSTTSDGSSGWTTITVDDDGQVGQFCSLAVVNGRPAISYLDATNSDLKYAYSSTADGSSGWTAITVDSDGSVGWDTTLAKVNGRPAIAYTGVTLKYAVPTN